MGKKTSTDASGRHHYVRPANKLWRSHTHYKCTTIKHLPIGMQDSLTLARPASSTCCLNAKLSMKSVGREQHAKCQRSFSGLYWTLDAAATEAAVASTGEFCRQFLLQQQQQHLDPLIACATTSLSCHTHTQTAEPILTEPWIKLDFAVPFSDDDCADVGARDTRQHRRQLVAQRKFVQNNKPTKKKLSIVLYTHTPVQAIAFLFSSL